MESKKYICNLKKQRFCVKHGNAVFVYIRKVREACFSLFRVEELENE